MTRSILLIILAVVLIVGELFGPMRWWMFAINIATIGFASATIKDELAFRRNVRKYQLHEYM